jgi:hypothetical protein
MVCLKSSKLYEEQYLVECDAVYYGRRLPTFRKNVLPPPSESKRKANKQQTTSKEQAVSRATFV